LADFYPATRFAATKSCLVLIVIRPPTLDVEVSQIVYSLDVSLEEIVTCKHVVHRERLTEP
jgi:hypothetical protein